MTITAQSILSAAEAQTKTQGKLAVMLREACQAKDFKVLLDAFKLSYEKHGQRSKSNGNVSTPTDSIRATINNVTSALVGTDGYPFEGALGIKRIDGEVTLYDKGAKETKRKGPNFNRIAKNYTTTAQKQAALDAFAKALGIRVGGDHG